MHGQRNIKVSENYLQMIKSSAVPLFFSNNSQNLREWRRTTLIFLLKNHCSCFLVSLTSLPAQATVEQVQNNVTEDFITTNENLLRERQYRYEISDGW